VRGRWRSRGEDVPDREDAGDEAYDTFRTYSCHYTEGDAREAAKAWLREEGTRPVSTRSARSSDDPERRPTVQVRVAVVRIFGTNDQYGDEPQTRPPGLPIVFEGFPESGASVQVEMGPVPSEIVEAERMRHAIGRTMLEALVGGERNPPTGPERVRQSFEEITEAALLGDYNWYTTLVLERTLSLTERPGVELDFFLPEKFWELEREAPVAAPALDVVTSIVSTIVDPGIFDNLVLDDRIHLFAEGKRPSGIPVFGGGGSATVTRGGSAPEMLGRRIDLLKTVDPSQLATQEWLNRVAHWRVQSLRERDPWKKFLWSFLALEILTNKLFDARRDDLLGQLRLLDAGGAVVPGTPPLEELAWARERAPLRSRFALVASDLFPDSARDDVREFASANGARGRLAHGAIRNPDELPIGGTQTLLDKYFTGAVKTLLLGLDPKQSWEDVSENGPVA